MNAFHWHVSCASSCSHDWRDRWPVLPWRICDRAYRQPRRPLLHGKLHNEAFRTQCSRDLVAQRSFPLASDSRSLSIDLLSSRCAPNYVFWVVIFLFLKPRCSVLGNRAYWCFFSRLWHSLRTAAPIFVTNFPFLIADVFAMCFLALLDLCVLKV